MVEADDQNGFFEISHENFIVENELNAERVKKVSMAIQQLPPRQREIVYLKFFHGLSYEEVEHIMDINYQVARNLLYQAIKSLKRILAYSGVLLTVCCV